MKTTLKRILIPVLVCLSGYVCAQTEQNDEMQTLLGSQARVRFYGAATTKFTSLYEKFGIVQNFRVGFMFNKRLGVGLDLNGSVPMLNYGDLFNDTRQIFLQVGYGGLYIEPVVASNQLIHLTFPMAIGSGWAGYIRTGNNQVSEPNPVSQDVFWYAEPSANVEINVARWLALGIGAGYRIINDLSLTNTPGSGLNGWSGNFTIRIGAF